METWLEREVRIHKVEQLSDCEEEEDVPDYFLDSSASEGHTLGSDEDINDEEFEFKFKVEEEQEIDSQQDMQLIVEQEPKRKGSDSHVVKTDDAKVIAPGEIFSIDNPVYTYDESEQSDKLVNKETVFDD